MQKIHSQGDSIRNLGAVRRKAVSLSPEELIETGYLKTDKSFPLVIQPTVKGVNLETWASSNREFIETQLLKHGAILFRNFNIKTVNEFEQFIVATSGEALEYRYRASPRTQVSGRIYTSTDYPAEQSIFPHNEHAYSPTFPLKIFFFCVTPAQQGGETPIGNCRKIFKRIDPKIRDRFIQKGVMYVRNFGDGFGLPWQTVFQTTEKSLVEEYCRNNDLEFEWKDGERLRTRQVGSAVVRHPRTGETVWFNHATFFHVSTLEPTIREALSANFNEEDLPTNTYYGDGSPIEISVLEHLREAYQQEMVTFPWQTGDILMLDNMLAVHGRRPFVAPRKVLVGMAEALNSKDVQLLGTEV
jgi:alpha-ketoglutarate-dependent taurine dioxygenase